MTSFKTAGTLRYSPKLLGQVQSENWWVVLDCDPEISRYFRHLYFIHTYRKLQRPAWGAHITVVANEEPEDARKPLWQKHEGLAVTIDVSMELCDNEKFFWLGVESPVLSEIRVELGLPPLPKHPFHLTIGNAPEAEVLSRP